VFHSEVYENWVQAAAMLNRGRVMADPHPLQGFAYSASFVLPVNSLIVFAAHQVTYSPSIDPLVTSASKRITDHYRGVPPVFLASSLGEV
jgi:hypothetical protein